MDLILPFIPHTTVLKLSIWTTTAYIDFTNRESALEFMKILQYNCGEKIDIGWTKSKAIDELHWFDFDTMLRLKCIANNWEVPIILFGSYYKEQSLQYCAVVLRNITDNYTEARCIFCIMHTDQLVDIHSRVCETVCTLIDGIGIFPDVNYLIDVQYNTAHILGCVVQLNNFIQVIGTRTSTENNNFEFDINELVDLSWAVAILCQMDGDVLIEKYYQTFQTNNVKTYLPYVSVLGNRLFGTIIPNYRRKLPIGHDLNDTKLNFALCHKSTSSNYNPDRPYTPTPQSQVQCINKNFKYVSFELQPLDLRHDRTSSQLKYLLFGDTRSYHPEKKLKIDIRNFIGTSYKNSFRTVHKADRPPPQ
ncbi:uncharacterized protein LOC119669847 [Teleopsis dalmanni]|uniref:uncharacterized protein LOC119669847 n=1 Tax=Teleopsis dalmanni TaxID=139649 RepID=UPI0018CF4B57|nr:uncharacterized protein LOC119669847 [Teleopsis dalmanni]